VFTARYGLSPYIPQIRFVFKRLMLQDLLIVVDSDHFISEHRQV